MSAETDKAAGRNTLLILLSAAIVLSLYINLGKVLFGSRYFTLLADGAVGLLGGWVILTHLLSGKRFRPIELLTLGFMLLGLAMILHPNVPTWLAGVEGYRSLMFQMLGLLIGLRAVRDSKDFFLLIKVVAIAAFPILLYGIKQFFVLSSFDYALIASNTAGLDTWQLFGKVRSFGLFNGPFHLGLCSGVVFWLAIGLWLKGKREGWLAVAVIAVLACVASLTRSSVVALIGSIPLVLFFVYRRYRFKVAVVTISAAAVVAIGSFVLRSQWEELGRMMDSISSVESIAEDSRLTTRFEGYRRAAGVVVEHPMGIGMGAAGDAMSRYFEPYGKIHVTSHNMFLWVLLETGVLGLVLFLSVWYYLIR
ncbi:hypothetical protein C3F09_08635, partial [candidate division GN15 bacterium]